MNYLTLDCTMDPTRVTRQTSRAAEGRSRRLGKRSIPPPVMLSLFPAEAPAEAASACFDRADEDPERWDGLS